MRHGYELKSSKYGIKASSNWILEGKIIIQETKVPIQN